MGLFGNSSRNESAVSGKTVVTIALQEQWSMVKISQLKEREN
jgi:hypothetical protein